MKTAIWNEHAERNYRSIAEKLTAGEEIPTETLIRYLFGLEEEDRILALEHLESGNDPAAIPALLEAAAGRDIDIALGASEVLRAFPHPDAVKILVAGLDDPSSEVRYVAVLALQDRRAPEAVDGLLQSLADLEPEVRREAVIALAAYRNPDFFLALRFALHDSSPAVRKAAVTAIAQFRNEAVGQDLIEALADTSWPVRREAARALSGYPGRPTERALFDVLSDDEWQVVKEALHSLGLLHTSEAHQLLPLLDHKAADVRREAVVAIANSGNPHFQPAIENLTTDGDIEVRRSARFAIQSLAAQEVGAYAV